MTTLAVGSLWQALVRVVAWRSADGGHKFFIEANDFFMVVAVRTGPGVEWQHVVIITVMGEVGHASEQWFNDPHVRRLS